MGYQKAHRPKQKVLCKAIKELSEKRARKGKGLGDTKDRQTIRLPCRANTGPIHRKTPVMFKPDELATWPSGLEVHKSLTTIKEGDVTILSINVTNNTNHDIALPRRVVLGLLRLVHSVTPVEVRFKNTETQTPDKELPCEEHKLTEKIESNLS